MQYRSHGLCFAFTPKESRIPLTVIIGLAMGIRSNAGIFSVLNGVLLRPLPYKNADRLTLLIGNVQRKERRGGSFPDYRDWKQQSRAPGNPVLNPPARPGRFHFRQGGKFT
jgi:hypothetical protein